MNTAAKVGGFAFGLAAVFGAATGIGALVGPIGTAQAETSSTHSSTSSTHGSTGADGQAGHDAMAGMGSATGADEHVPGGLMISQNGYTFALAADHLPAGAATPVAFRILGPDGRAVTAYDRTHDEDLHLIAVRRDLTGFQHVHPQLGADGTWSIPLALTPGEWRVFADFTPAGGTNLTLGSDVAVAGNYTPQPLPAPSTTAQVDGYTVTLDGRLVPGQESELTLSVSRDGRPVTDLQPYLAAYGHLVALREGDLAYLHVHPAGEPGDGTTQPGPEVTFYATAPSAGTYRLFLDFKHEGVVHTAEFTATAGQSGAAGNTTSPASASPPDGGAVHGGDGHSHG